MDTAKPAEPSRLDVLDGWRTISIALVILCHLTEISSIRLAPGQLGPASPIVAMMGTTGVNIFFVISGFVICRGMLREEAAFGKVSLRAFYIRRFLRILPPLVLYVCVILLLTSLRVVGEQHWSVWRALTFTCNVPGANCGVYLGGHTWSLSVEEQFYVAAPALFVISTVVRGAGALWLLGATFLTALCLFLMGHPSAAAFVLNFLIIMTGVACALHESALRRFVARLPSIVVPLLVVGLVFSARLQLSRLWLPATAFSAIIIAAVLMKTTFSDGFASRFLAAPAMLAVGRVSYSIYLWQELATYPFAGAGTVFYLVSVTACIAFSFLSFAFLERPLIALGKTWSDGLKGAS
jgi:peptidoglycan/LPS O-acetylase OafA/YrhL